MDVVVRNYHAHMVIMIFSNTEIFTVLSILTAQATLLRDMRMGVQELAQHILNG